jgi:ADP-ribosylglycohydrolase
VTQASARAAGALYGLAIGDALGMPTQALPRDQIVARYGSLMATFQAAPAAFAVAAASPGDPWLACRIAASLGGDCDTIAALAGAVTGACHGAEAFPARARSTIDTVNGLGLDELARDLLRVRAGARAGSEPGR